MPEVLEQDRGVTRTLPAPASAVPRTAPAERLARRDLLHQIERLEYELSALLQSTWPRKGFDLSVGESGGPRLLSLGELEEARDHLLHRADHVQRALGDRTRVEEEHRRRIEEMLIEPEAHRWVRIGNEDIGEPGCRHWHVRPRWGLLGMLMNWWRVRISSGCPLPGPRPRGPGSPYRPAHGAA